MTKTQIQELALDLPDDERRELAESLVESLGPAIDEVPDWHREILAERWRAYDRNDEETFTWEEVQQSVWGTPGDRREAQKPSS